MAGDLDTLIDTSKFLLALSQVYQQQQKYEERLDYLIKAKEAQDKLALAYTFYIIDGGMAN